MPSIALIFGGRGHEREISLISAEYIYSLIEKERYSLTTVFISECGEWLIPVEGHTSPRNTERFTEEVTLARHCGNAGLLLHSGFIPLDAALPVLHGDLGEDGTLAGVFENAGLKYVGCDLASSALCADKAYTAAVADKLGIPTVREIVSRKGESTSTLSDRAEETIGYPMFVKPSRLGSSIGAACAEDRGELMCAIDAARALSDRVLIQERIDIVREIECAYFSAQGETVISDVGSIEYDGGFYDFSSKYLKDNARVSDRAETGSHISDMARSYTERLAEYIGLRHLSRIDFFLASDGRLIFNEINTFPGFTSASLYPRLIERAGISPRTLVRMLIDDTLA